MPNPNLIPVIRRAPPSSRRAGFTMVELIVVLIVVGILGAIGAARFFNRSGFDAAAYAEQVRGMVRYAQKLAVAQNRPVYVQGMLSGVNVQGVALCFVANSPCPAAAQVPAPGGNSGSSGTRASCLANGVYAPAWYCEGVPASVGFSPITGSLATFYFSGIGRPYAPDDVPKNDPTGSAQVSNFSQISVAIAADGISSTITVSPETGYVY